MHYCVLLEACCCQRSTFLAYSDRAGGLHLLPARAVLQHEIVVQRLSLPWLVFPVHGKRSRREGTNFVAWCVACESAVDYVLSSHVLSAP